MSAFWAMGGYAAYVWPAYVVSIGALAIAAALTLRAHASAKAMLAALEKP
jgi:heme exporter protein CcmD